MAEPPRTIRPPAPIPAAFTASVYLAGPAAADDAGGWRRRATELLGAGGFDGLVFDPQPMADGGDAEQQAAWEEAALRQADAILFWRPGQWDAEVGAHWGAWRRSGKAVLGIGEPGPGRGPVFQAATRLRVPVGHLLAEAVELLLPLLRPGAQRSGGERAVPLLVWRSPAFQRWYRDLRAVGNVLDDIEIEWSYRPRALSGKPPLLFAHRPKVWVRGERRHKAGEVVVARSDVSATVLYQPRPQLLDTPVVLVREFRSAVHNRSGYVWELPGGSAERAAEADHDPRLTALREVEQETGLTLKPPQIQPVPVGARQVSATLLCHRAHLFRAILSGEQLESLRRSEERGTRFGANPSERCYVAVRTVGEIVRNGNVDWTQIGMILYALGAAAPRRGEGEHD